MVQKIRIKRAYEPAGGDDVARILVDRLWPRGVKKEELAIHFWAKDIAPSDALRAWYGHEATKWEEFASDISKSCMPIRRASRH